jgi:hypothetical protein
MTRDTITQPKLSGKPGQAPTVSVGILGCAAVLGWVLFDPFTDPWPETIPCITARDCEQ